MLLSLLIAQATQPTTQTTVIWGTNFSVTEFGVAFGAFVVVAIAIIEGIKRLAKYVIESWFDTKKFIRDQQAATQTNAKAILNIADKMNASNAVDSPDPNVIAPVQSVAITGTGDGGTAKNPTVPNP